MKVKKIPAKKGGKIVYCYLSYLQLLLDFIIWRREIAHGNGHNVSGRPRLAQYINMFPARGNSTEKLTPQQSLHPEHRFQRIEMFENRVGPFHKPCDKRLVEKNSNGVHLTELGKVRENSLIVLLIFFIRNYWEVKCGMNKNERIHCNVCK